MNRILKSLAMAAFLATASQATIGWGFNVPIKRIVAAKTGAYLYIEPSRIPGITKCNKATPNGGISYTIIYVPNNNVLNELLAAFHGNVVMKSLAITDADVARAPNQVSATTCSVEYVDFE